MKRGLISEFTFINIDFNFINRSICGMPFLPGQLVLRGKQIVLQATKIGLSPALIVNNDIFMQSAKINI